MDKTLIVLKPTSTRKQFNDALRKIKHHKNFNAKKYLGVLKGVYGNAMDYQTQLRDEWT